MTSFNILTTPIAGLKIVQRKRIEDSRGYLSRFYCADEFKTVGVHQRIAQINHTFTRSKGAVRGMHFQWPPHAEAKLVSCIQGEIFDVAVDLRKDSPTFLQWHGVVLSDANQCSLLIPEGFAHGFQTMTNDCVLIYLHTASYYSAAEGALNVCDPRLAINWPHEITEISERDRTHHMLSANFEGIKL